MHRISKLAIVDWVLQAGPTRIRGEQSGSMILIMMILEEYFYHHSHRRSLPPYFYYFLPNYFHFHFHFQSIIITAAIGSIWYLPMIRDEIQRVCVDWDVPIWLRISFLRPVPYVSRVLYTERMAMIMAMMLMLMLMAMDSSLMMMISFLLATPNSLRRQSIDGIPPVSKHFESRRRNNLWKNNIF